MNKYSEKSLDELLSYFGDEFYQFVPTKEDFIWYLTEISHRIIEENGIKQFPQYNFFYNMQKNTMLGSYSAGTIKMNNNLTNGFDYFKEKNNLHYVFKMIDSIIHETRHFLQDKQVESVSPIVKQYYTLDIFLPDDNNVSYFTNVYEIDARYYTYQVMKEKDNLKTYISTKYRDEEYTRSTFLSSHYANILMLQKGNYSSLTKFNAESFKKVYMPFLESLGIDIDRMTAFLLTKTKRNDYLIKKAFETDPKLKSSYEYFANNIQLRSKSNLRLQEYMATMADNSSLRKKSIDEETRNALWQSLGRLAYVCHESNNLYKNIAPEFDEFKKPEIDITSQRQKDEENVFNEVLYD